jgi:hypothetical protein
MNGVWADLMPIWTVPGVTPQAPRNLLVSDAQISKKPAKIGHNFTRIQTGNNRALTMPNIRPDLIRI